MAKDIYWTSTKLLLHCDSLVDTSPTPKTITANGSAVTPYTADSVYGGGCLNFDGVSYVTTPGHADFNFGTGDFTVEFFIKVAQRGTDVVPLDYYMVGVSGWQFIVKAAGNVTIYEGNPNTTALTGVRFVADNQWHHIALCREAGILTLFIDGSVDMWIANTKNHSGTPTYLALGAQVSSRNSAYDFIGKLDEVRITQGFARYVGEFIPAQPAEGASVVSGTVRDAAGALCSRTVNVHARASGRLLGTAVSDPTTGVFEIGATEQCYAVVLDSTGVLNSLILDRLDPVL